MSWCAEKVARENPSSIRVDYGERVERIEHVPEKDVIRVWSVDTTSGERRQRLARNLIVSTGGSPFIPPVFNPVKNLGGVLHTSEYLARIDQVLAENVPDRDHDDDGIGPRIAVIGAGQSAAEVFLDVKARLAARGAKRAEVHLLFRKTNLHPSDDTPYVPYFPPP
jgi:L-ornithine N5-oxygenase